LVQLLACGAPRVTNAPRAFRAPGESHGRSTEQEVAHNALSTPGTAVEPTTGETHLRHHISPTGFYRGRKVLKTKADA
jgi:large subunit ribosomal protein L32